MAILERSTFTLSRFRKEEIKVATRVKEKLLIIERTTMRPRPLPDISGCLPEKLRWSSI